MTKIIIAFVLFLIMFFVAQFIIDKADKKLGQDEKANLITLFSNIKKFTFGILISVIILFYFNLQFDYVNLEISLLVYGILTISVIVFSGYSSFNKLKENNYPDSYIKSYLISSTINFLALVLIFALLKL